MGHFQYVLDSLQKNRTKVVNIRKYMLAALYNAPATMDSYYVSQVNHDKEKEGKKLRGRIGRFKDYRYAEGESLWYISGKRARQLEVCRAELF